MPVYHARYRRYRWELSVAREWARICRCIVRVTAGIGGGSSVAHGDTRVWRMGADGPTYCARHRWMSAQWRGRSRARAGHRILPDLKFFRSHHLDKWECYCHPGAEMLPERRW
jgi:hypothetical protein